MTECIKRVRHSKIRVEENKRKAIFLNEERTEHDVGKIDGCLINDGIRADYFVSNFDKTVLVELKGVNIGHACQQLFAAIEHKNVRPNIRNQVGFVVICSRVPTGSTATQLAKQKAKKKFGAKFQVFCRQRELRISDC